MEIQYQSNIFKKNKTIMVVQKKIINLYEIFFININKIQHLPFLNFDYEINLLNLREKDLNEININ